MRFLFHPAAGDEFDLAVEYYETCQSGLGLEFAEDAFRLKILKNTNIDSIRCSKFPTVL